MNNTIIPYNWIKSHSYQYQRLLQKMANCLVDERKWWREGEKGVECFDKETPNGESFKQLHHFRSTSISNERLYMNKCWEECLKDKNRLIPAYKLKLEEGSEMRVVYFKTISKMRLMR